MQFNLFEILIISTATIIGSLVLLMSIQTLSNSKKSAVINGESTEKKKLKGFFLFLLIGAFLLSVNISVSHFIAPISDIEHNSSSSHLSMIDTLSGNKSMALIGAIDAPTKQKNNIIPDLIENKQKENPIKEKLNVEQKNNTSFVGRGVGKHSIKLVLDTIEKTLNPNRSTYIQFNTNHTSIELEPWDENFIHVEITITTNAPSKVSAQLIKDGRYELFGKAKKDSFYITTPSMKKSILLVNENLEEKINIKIKAPGYFSIQDSNVSMEFSLKQMSDIVPRGAGKEEAAEMLRRMRQIKSYIHTKTIVISKYEQNIDLSKYQLTIDGIKVMADQIGL